MSPSVVLVTGASRFVGGQLAVRLAADPEIDRVLAVDTVPPAPELMRRMRRAEFVRADLRNPLIAKVISTAKVDTVVHASTSAHPPDAGGYRSGRSTIKEMNVIGTMQLLAACQKSTTLTRLIVKSTGAVYGASPLDQAMFTERDEPHVTPASGYAKDAVEVEGYIRGFARRRDDVGVTVLRFANIVGPRVDTVLTRYFSLPLVPTVWGYDGRLQLLHEQDALAVLERATRAGIPGVFNVGGDGVLLVSQAIPPGGPITGSLPGPAGDARGRLLHSAAHNYKAPEQTRFLNFGRVLDTTRLRTEFGYLPRWTTSQAFDDFARGAALRPTVDPRWIATAERGVLSLAGRFR